VGAGSLDGVVAFLSNFFEEVVAEFVLQSIRSGGGVVFGIVDPSDVTIGMLNKDSTTVVRVDVMRLDYLVTVG
jgi:hypothetical protein